MMLTLPNDNSLSIGYIILLVYVQIKQKNKIENGLFTLGSVFMLSEVMF